MTHTYKQHLDYFLANGMTVCPIKQFWKDLESELNAWILQGDQIVLGGDWNHHIDKVNKILKKFNLKESITSVHGINKAPNTSLSGSKPIDGIYTSATLKGINCGYMPFFKGEISPNHRPIWIDLPMDAVLGFTMQDMPRSFMKRLKMSDPRIVEKYQEALHKHSVEHNLYNKTAAVLKKATYPLSQAMQEEFAKLDHQRCLGMRYAEKQCRNLHTGKYAWSPEFTTCRRLLAFWSLMVKRHEGVNVHSARMVRLLKKLDLPLDMLSTGAELSQKYLVEAKERYKLAKTNASANRVKYLEGLAKAKSDSDDESKIASKLRALIHCTTKVLVVDKDGNIKVITSRTELEKVIVKENIQKYHKTEKYCPLLVGQLRHDIGLCGNGPQVEAILDGTYKCPPGTPEGTRLYIEAMKRPHLTAKARRKASFTSVEEFARCWNRAKESSSSAGQLHYAHYKAGCRHQTLKLLHYMMAQISLESGCYLAKHRKGVDVMLLKKEGDYRLHRLRTICLFDAEFNMNNGRVGAAGLASAIESGDMADEQYSRPCRGSLDHVVNRVLSFNYFMYHRRPFGLCSCDLAGNYDRIVHAAASLALQRLGVPQARVVGMFDTIQRMIKKVRTAYGESDITYGGDDVEREFIAPPQGVYQGNRNGPPVWSVISSTVFSILRKQGFGVKFITAISHDLFHLCGFAFVDDSDLVMDGTSCFQVSADLQDALVLWEGVMHATGQAMAPEKSWWYLVDFIWEKGVWKMTDGQTRTDLIAHDSDGVAHSLKRVMFDRAKKMLGVFLAPNGDMTAEVEYLKDKAVVWAEYIRSGHLNKKEIWVALSTYIWKTITYPLAATTFTEDQIKSITWPILEVALPRMDVCRTISKALRYGPKNLGGLGLDDPFLEQGVRKVEYVVEQVWKNTPTGYLIRANLEALSLESGTVGAILERDSTPLTWVSTPTTWVQSLWKFLSTNRIRISGVSKSHIALQRQHDVPIMDSFDAMEYPTPVMKALNRCRMFLQITTLSDITLACGTALDVKALPHRGGKAQGGFSRNHFSWPPQQNPPQQDWTIWRDCLIQTFCANESGTLATQLGEWTPLTDDPRDTLPFWDWYGLPDSKGDICLLWRYGKDGWRRFSPLSRRATRQQCFSPVGRTTATPSATHLPCLVRVNVARRHGYYICTSKSKSPLGSQVGKSTQADKTRHFIHILSRLAESKWLFATLQIHGDLDAIVQALFDGTLLSVSDGSYSPATHYGTASFLLETLDGASHIRCECVVPGLPYLQNSYRSELAGLLGISALLFGLWQYSDKRGAPLGLWDVIVGCDGKSALHKSMSSHPDRLTTRAKQFDMIAAIMGYWKHLPCDTFPVHVRSHLDDLYDTSQLSRLEQMNVVVDRHAQDFLHYNVQHAIPSGALDQVQFGMPVVSFRGEILGSSLKSTLLDYCTRYSLQEYWATRWNLHRLTSEPFNWPAFTRAMGGYHVIRHILFQNGFHARRVWGLENDHVETMANAHGADHLLMMKHTAFGAQRYASNSRHCLTISVPL